MEFTRERPGRIQIHKVVVRKLLALKLPGSRESSDRAPGRNVKRRSLMRIFAVARIVCRRSSAM